MGQLQTIAGYERVRQGNVLFCGEHTSLDLQGWFEGAASEGVRAGKEILAGIVERAGPDAADAKHPVVNYVKAKPGRYTVSYRLRFPQVVEVPENTDDWKGELETAPVTIEVKAAGAAPTGDAAPSRRIGRNPSRIAGRRAARFRHAPATRFFYRLRGSCCFGQ